MTNLGKCFSNFEGPLPGAIEHFHRVPGRLFYVLKPEAPEQRFPTPWCRPIWQGHVDAAIAVFEF
ncbi:hypothetical protein [Egbenema bharatensis]|uniref:hypothetical protein n=1 Tax=Egbenema bharatensis TaxID=3463334 RepID=UPI003A84B891